MSKPEPLSVISLRERIEKLSSKRQETISTILEHPREYVLLSIRALAKRLKTDPATIVRIVQGLGFENYKQFQHHLFHQLSAGICHISRYHEPEPARERLPKQPAADAILRDLKNIQGLKNASDPDRFTRLAKRIYSARRIVIIAGDLAVVIAEYLSWQLNVLNLPVVMATSAGSIQHTVRSLSKQDLVLAITFRRGLRTTVEGVEQARSERSTAWGSRIPMLPRLREPATSFSSLRSIRCRSASPTPRPWPSQMQFCTSRRKLPPFSHHANRSRNCGSTVPLPLVSLLGSVKSL